jgi:hypothetical protein
MAEEQPSIHIDTDWKKQAQQEKQRLAEQEKAAAAARAPAAVGPPAPASGGPAAEPGARPRAAAGRGEGRELPPASFPTLVQSIMTQTLFYLGDIAPQGGQPTVNLDMAKLQIDTLTMLEQKTTGNLTDEEKRLLDTVLYDLRMRYVQAAAQVIG